MPREAADLHSSNPCKDKFLLNPTAQCKLNLPQVHWSLENYGDAVPALEKEMGRTLNKVV